MRDVRKMISLGRKTLFVLLAMSIVIASVGAASAYTYDRDKAVKYANDNARGGNPGYEIFSKVVDGKYVNGGDCTNYISWCLNAGGWIPVSSNTNGALNWFYNSQNPLSKSSESWKGVQAFRNYATASGRATEVVFSKGSNNPPMFTKIKKGDIIQMDFEGDGTYDHSSIVTYAKNGAFSSHIHVNYHSHDKKNVDLKDVRKKCKNVRFRAFLIKDSYTK